MMINPELTNQIFKSMPIPYLVLATDSPKFTILEVSNLYLEVTGTEASEVLGKGLLEIYPYASHEGQPEGSSKLLQSLDNLMQTQKTQVITFLVYDTISRVSKKSVKRFLSTEHTPIFDTSGEINCILHTVKPSEENEEINQFRSLFWENPDPVFALNLNGKIIRANAAFEELAEYNGQKWNDQTFISFVPLKNQKKIQALLGRTLKGEIHTFDSDFVTHSGNLKIINITIIPLQVNGEIVGINAMAKDITETKHLLALESLEKSVLEMSSKKNASLNEIFDFYIEGIENLHDSMLCSIMEVRDNRLYHMASRSLPSEFLKKIEGEAIGENAASCGTAAFLKKKVVVQDISTDICYTKYREIATSNNLHACWSFPLMNSSQDVMATFSVYYHMTKNPTSVELNTVERAGKILQIILESKQNENALQISNQRYEYLTQTTTEAIWDWDLVSNTIFRGIGFQKIFGHKFNQKKIDSSYWKTHVHSGDYERLMKKMDEAIQDNKKSWEYKYRYLLGDGTYSYVHNRGYVVREASGKAIRMVGALRDISQEKIHEREKNLKLFISNIFAQEKTLELALQESLKGILAYTELAFAEAWVINIDKTSINLTAFTGKKTMMDANEILSFHKKIGLPGKSWESKEPVFVADIQSSGYFLRKDFASRHNLVSAVALPIKIQDEVIGVITLFSQQPLTSNSISSLLGNSVPNRLASEVHRKKTESELNLFFDLSPDLLCIAGFDGYFKKINFAFETLLGYKKGEILKTSYENLTHPADRQSTQISLLELEAGNPIPYLENRFKTKSGHYVWLAWSLTPLPGEKLVFATAKDISEKKN